MDRHAAWTALLAATFAVVTLQSGAAAGLCRGYGPQAPRDISMKGGANHQIFNIAPPAENLNLCNIHAHANAEHRGPGFEIYAPSSGPSGYQCNTTGTLSLKELEDPAHGHGAFHGARPGDTIEVHWVYTSCDVAPGPGLGACLSQSCANPQLRVESQVFLLANNPEDGLDFNDFIYEGPSPDGHHQPKALPTGTGEPVVFAGSTTGPKYSQSICSPLQVTWSVRPNCAKLDIQSLHKWAAEGNIFEENHAHGVRPLVTARELLSAIE